MSYQTARKAITDRLKTYTGNPPIFAENQPGGTQTAPWVRWSIRPASTVDSTVGATRQRTVGTLFFQLFIPEETGTLAAEQFADKIGALLNAKALASGPIALGGPSGVVVFERAELKYAGRSDGYSQHNVTVAYREDHVALNAT